MPNPVFMRPLRRTGVGILLLLGLAAAACQSRSGPAEAAPKPPVGHFEGSLSPAGRPGLRAALDIRHPSPGHYEAELTVPTAPALSFVADTIFFAHNQLRLTRPARPGQTLALTLDGDFWRGDLALDSATVPAILLRRGEPSPRTYRVEEVPQAEGSAWLFASADVSMTGPALVLFPDAGSGAAAPIWADALAREGIIVLVLPLADSLTASDEKTRLQTALRLLRNTAGVDTATIGAWAAGPRAAALAQALATADGPRVAYFIAQNAPVDEMTRAAIQELRKREMPMLGLYGGVAAVGQAAAWRRALGGARGATVQTYRTTGPGLLVPGTLSPSLKPGLPGAVLEWLRAR